MYQTTLYSSYSAVITAPDSGCYVAGNVAVDNSFSSYGLLRELNYAGSVLMETQVQVPGYETTNINSLAQTEGGTLLVAGVASAGCDYGPFEGLLAAFTSTGSPLWQRQFTAGPVQDMAVNDSLIALLGYYPPYLLFTDQNGDSLYQTSIDLGYGNKVKANSIGFACLGSQGVLQLLPDGSVADTLSGLSAVDLVDLGNGQQVLLTVDSLLLLTSGLERTGIGVAVSSNSGWLSLDAPQVCVIGQDSSYLYNSDLNFVESHSFELPSGFNLRDVNANFGQLVTVGDLSSGAIGAAIRSQPLLGMASPLEMDIALVGLSVDSMQLTYSPITNGVYFQGPIWLHGWVKNNGDLPVDHLTLDQVLPYGICSPAGFNYPFDGLALAPGDSMYMAMGQFAIYDAETQSPTAPIHRNICIWAASPDNRLDRNVADNEGCVDLLIPLGVDELQAKARPKVYPNPAADHVFVELSEPISPSMTWTLTDLMGRKVGVNMEVTGDRTMRSDLSELAQGSYVLSMSNDVAHWSSLVVRQ